MEGKQWRSQDFLKGEANFQGGPKVTPTKNWKPSELAHYFWEGGRFQKTKQNKKQKQNTRIWQGAYAGPEGTHLKKNPLTGKI